MPTASPFTSQDFEDFMDFEARLFYSSGMRKNDRYCHALNMSLFVGGPCVLGAQKIGALCIHAGTIPSERLLRIMIQFQPTITWTTPSYAWYLGETAQKQGIDVAHDTSKNKKFVAGEPGGSIKATKRELSSCGMLMFMTTMDYQTYSVHVLGNVRKSQDCILPRII